MAWTIKGNDGREYDWRCFFGKHRYTPWQVEQNPTPYTPEWAMSWKTCERCGEWVWKPTMREHVTTVIVCALLVVGMLIPVVAGVIKIWERMA